MSREKITIMMSEEFVDWWNERWPPHIKENQTIMTIAWWTWEEATKQVIALNMSHNEGGEMR